MAIVGEVFVWVQTADFLEQVANEIRDLID